METNEQPPPVNVLIVDDRPENLLALEAVLAPLGVITVQALSGKEALRCLLREDFALILLDAQMPEMDGYETAAMIRQRKRTATTPIIFVTAVDKTHSQIFRGYASGAVDFVFKPIEPEVLRAKVRVFTEIYNHRRKIEEQAERLRISEERYSLAAAGANDGLWDWDVQSGVAYFSPRWYEITGADPATFGPTLATWLGLVPPDEQAALKDALDEHLLGRSHHFEIEHRIAPSNEEDERWVLCRGIAVRDQHNRPVRMAGSLSDITHRKRSEAEARKQERLATIGMTVANISHSMKNIFMALQGSVTLLGKFVNPEDTRVRQVLPIMESSVQRLNLLIMTMLDYSKEREAIRERIQCNRLFEELRRLLTNLAERANAMLEFEIEPGAEEFAHDSDRLLRALMNLGTNALDALPPEGGRVTFRAGTCMPDKCGLDPDELARRNLTGGPVLWLEVADTGLGIPEELRRKVFDPFFSTKGSRGTGLGLPSVRQFVEEAGGVLELHTAEDEGTAFKMYFFDRLCLEVELDSAAV